MFLKTEIVFLSLYFFWLLILTFLFVRFYLYYKRLLKNTSKKNLVSVLDELFEKDKAGKKEIEGVVKSLQAIESKGSLHIQKIGLVRFNPFQDTGGDQSFVLSILNAKNDGVVISSLHSRTGARWYAKKVINGKGQEYGLSLDEEKAVNQAKVLDQG